MPSSIDSPSLPEPLLRKLPVLSVVFAPLTGSTLTSLGATPSPFVRTRIALSLRTAMASARVPAANGGHLALRAVGRVDPDDRAPAGGDDRSVVLDRDRRRIVEQTVVGELDEVAGLRVDADHARSGLLDENGDQVAVRSHDHVEELGTPGCDRP